MSDVIDGFTTGSSGTWPRKNSKFLPLQHYFAGWICIGLGVLMALTAAKTELLSVMRPDECHQVTKPSSIVLRSIELGPTGKYQLRLHLRESLRLYCPHHAGRFYFTDLDNLIRRETGPLRR